MDLDPHGNLKETKLVIATFACSLQLSSPFFVSVGFIYDTADKKGEWQGEIYDYVQENLLINHVAVGVPVGRMRAPFIGLGCDAFDFEADQSLTLSSVDTKVAETTTPPVAIFSIIGK